MDFSNGTADCVGFNGLISLQNEDLVFVSWMLLSVIALGLLIIIFFLKFHLAHNNIALCLALTAIILLTDFDVND